MRPAALLALPLAAVLALAACSSDKNTSGGDKTSSTTTPGTSATTASSSSTTAPGVTMSAISPERCAENKKAGKITYLSGFDFAASAGIVEVVMAKAKGYFDKMCLDVDLKGSFSTANYPLVATGKAQFASAGSYSEMLDFANQNKTTFVAVSHDGKTGIDALVVKPDIGVNQLTDLKGKTIGVKGKITPSVKAMLAKAGLVEGTDYKTVLIDGFDPTVHIKLPIAGFPVYKSNEPGQLDRAGIKYQLFDPSKDGIPGSFGVIYTSKDFADSHPTAVEDFVRAAMKGLADAIADPQTAVNESLKLIKEGGNKNFLSTEGESFRWKTEADLVESTTKASGQPLGAIVPKLLQDEVDGLTAAGIFATKPPIDGTYSDVTQKIYDASGQLIWPS